MYFNTILCHCQGLLGNKCLYALKLHGGKALQCCVIASKQHNIKISNNTSYIKAVGCFTPEAAHKLHIKVDLNWIILKNFKISASHTPCCCAALCISAENRSHLPFGKCELFEISCADIALPIDFFCKLKRGSSRKAALQDVFKC